MINIIPERGRRRRREGEGERERREGEREKETKTEDFIFVDLITKFILPEKKLLIKRIIPQ